MHIIHSHIYFICKLNLHSPYRLLSHNKIISALIISPFMYLVSKIMYCTTSRSLSHTHKKTSVWLIMENTLTGITQKLTFCHHLLMLFQTCIILCLLLNTKEDLENVGNQPVHATNWLSWKKALYGGQWVQSTVWLVCRIGDVEKKDDGVKMLLTFFFFFFWHLPATQSSLGKVKWLRKIVSFVLFELTGNKTLMLIEEVAVQLN